jgi:hypothetical protein
VSGSPARLYHLIPGNMVGDVLYPLNVLREVEPVVYQDHVAKYEGRGSLLTHVIPPLGVLWNDVLHLSPVHPAQIRDGLEAAGFPWFPDGIDCLEIDPDQVGLDRSNSCLRQSRVPADPRPADGDPYEPYSREAIALHAQLPDAVVGYYRSCFETGRRPLLFQGVTHVLFKGSIRLVDGVRMRV